MTFDLDQAETAGADVAEPANVAKARNADAVLPGRGEADEDDLAMLQELAELLRESSLCGLGQTAPNPVVSTLKYFPAEYEAHIKDHRCPAGRCKFESCEEALA